MKKRLLAALTAIALLAGCGQAETASAPGGKLPDATAAPEVEVESDMTADTVPLAYDDSRITETYAEDGSYTDKYGKATRYSYHLPQIEDDTDTAEFMNANIQSRFGELITYNKTLRLKKEALENDMVTWESSWNGSLLSLYIAATDLTGGREVGVYHYDFDTGSALTNDELLEQLGYDYGEVKNALQRAAAQQFDRRFAEAPAAPELTCLRVRTISDSNCDPLAVALFPTGEGLRAALPLYTPAGAGVEMTDISFDPAAGFGTGKELQGQDEWFHAAVWKDGSVEIWTDTDYTVDGLTYADLVARYGLANTTDWLVNGCYHNYTDLCMASIGQDYAPYVFLLTEDGTVEYIDVLRNAVYGTMYSGGPLYGVKDIVRFEEDEAELDGMDYHTVYGVDAYGNRFNLYETILQLDKLPADLLGSWSTTLNDRHIWLELRDDYPSLFYGSSETDGEGIVSPDDAWVEYLGQSGVGLVYALNAGGEYEIAAFGPDYEALYARHLGSERLTDITDYDYLCFERTYG